MKKNILILIMLIPVLGFISACKKSSFDERYNDPEKTTEGTIDGFYTGLFKNRRVIPEYWHLWTFTSLQMGTFTQSLGFVKGEKIYEPGVAYPQDRWNDFYATQGGDGNWTAPVANFREMEKLYNDLSLDADKEGYLLFMETGRIFLLDQATQVVDLWGDIPFSEAGLLNKNGALTLPKYDEGKQVYDSALFHLKRISNWLATTAPQQFYLAKLTKQDVLFKGDLTKWRRYANSLMLRLAMRISYVDEPQAQALVQEILGNPTRYPLLDNITDNVAITTGPAVNLPINLRDAFNQNHNLAPDYMVDSLLEPSGDPRLRLLFTRNAVGQYQGLPRSLTQTEQQDMVSNQLVSLLDSVTFTMNQSFPGIIMTAAEVSFLKAEAYERWGGGNARQAYETGIKQSIDYYYRIHQLSTWGTQETAPTNPEYTLLIAHPLVAYGTVREENLNKIGLQKWVDFGVMQNNQSWAEIRRSGYPKLTFPVDASSNVAPLPPYRFLYPTNEALFNGENYSKVKDKDKPFTKIFWMR